MLTWLLAHPLARKLAFYAGIILAIFLCLRWYGNQQWKKGEQAGRQTMAREIEQKKQAEWQAREKELEAAAATVAAQKADVEAALSRLAQERIGLSQTLTDSLEAIREERIRHYETVADINSADLDGALRAVSAELAAAQ